MTTAWFSRQSSHAAFVTQAEIDASNEGLT